MSFKIIFIIIQVCAVSSAPFLNLLQYRNVIERSQILQQQLLELQALNQWGSIAQIPQDPLSTLSRPIIVLLPNENTPITKRNDILNKRINDRLENDLANANRDAEDSDSIVIDAAPATTTHDHKKALLLLPNARLSIGDIISAIPFLPIEINVPDTIAWIYNAIASIISRPQQTTAALNLKSNAMSTSNMNTPIMLIPVNVANPFQKPLI